MRIQVVFLVLLAQLCRATTFDEGGFTEGSKGQSEFESSQSGQFQDLFSSNPDRYVKPASFPHQRRWANLYTRQGDAGTVQNDNGGQLQIQQQQQQQQSTNSPNAALYINQRVADSPAISSQVSAPSQGCTPFSDLQSQESPASIIATAVLDLKVVDLSSVPTGTLFIPNNDAAQTLLSELGMDVSSLSELQAEKLKSLLAYHYVPDKKVLSADVATEPAFLQTSLASCSPICHVYVQNIGVFKWFDTVTIRDAVDPPATVLDDAKDIQTCEGLVVHVLDAALQPCPVNTGFDTRLGAITSTATPNNHAFSAPLIIPIQAPQHHSIDTPNQAEQTHSESTIQPEQALVQEATTGCTPLSALKNDPDVGYLATAVSDLQLAPFQSDGTIFAPTNDALLSLYQSFGKDSLGALLGDQRVKGLLVSILRYHFYPDIILDSSQITMTPKKLESAMTAKICQEQLSGVSVRLLAGRVSVEDGGPRPARVVKSDVKVCEGVIHVVDDVLEACRL